MAKRTPALFSSETLEQRDLLMQMDACQLLKQLRERNLQSRAMAAFCRGLLPSRLSAPVSFPVRRGLIKKPAHGRSAAGQPAGSWCINADDGHVIGVDIGGSNLRIGLADMKGTVLGKWSTSTKKTSSPDMVIEQIRKGVNYLQEHACVPPRSLLAVAAGAPGVTDPDAGVVVATSYLKGWKHVPLRDALEATFGIPAAVENDARLAALGENWTGAARGIDSFVFLAIGTGIAAGIFANGKLIHGTNWTAGEVGYMHVPGTPEEAASPGSPGSLESIIGGEGIRQQWLRSCNGMSDPRARALTATEIFDRACTGDLLANRILNRSAQVLAFAVYNISLVLNCALFVLGGKVGMCAPLHDATRRVLEQYNEPARPKLIISRLGEDAQLMGAIRLALNTAESRIGLRTQD